MIRMSTSLFVSMCLCSVALSGPLIQSLTVWWWPGRGSGKRVWGETSAPRARSGPFGADRPSLS